MVIRQPGSAPTPASPVVATAVEECAAALAFVQRSLKVTGVDFADYKMIRGENLFTIRGASVWRLTFKLRRLLPADPESPIGAGGEIFIEVDPRAERIQSVVFGE